MTDTTDIEALRNRAASEVIANKGLISAELAMILINQLEAERQRAERGEASAGIIQQMYNELKGERVPVAITDDMAIAFHAATADSDLGRDDMEEIKAGLRAVQELFTAPQKPVVLPEKSINDYNRYWIDYQDTVAAIEAAGGIVKDGE